MPTQGFIFTHIYIAHSSATDIIHFPSFAKLNAELFGWHPGKEEVLAADESLCIELDVFATDLTTQPPPNPAPTLASPCVPDISNLTSQLFASDNKLFFIFHQIPGSTITEWHLPQVNVKTSIK